MSVQTCLAVATLGTPELTGEGSDGAALLWLAGFQRHTLNTPV